ncbi:hypothetical protein B7L68_05205 [Thermoproteus sp. CP80]|nr:hypothetical protein B7L68_05205 [Thermoproteus sp. CP80]
MDRLALSASTLASALDAGRDPSGRSAPTIAGVGLRASLPQIGMYSRRSPAAASRSPSAAAAGHSGRSA